MSFKSETLLLKSPQKSGALIPLAFAYPNSYAVGMSGLGYQLVWWLLEQDPELQTFRVFTDTCQEGWQQCELLGFTLSWELDYAGLLKILKEAKIPALAKDRCDGSYPLVFGGGPVLSANPEPFAEIFDLILLGDAELTIPNLIKGWKESRILSSKKEQLKHLSGYGGIYVPSFFQYEFESQNGPIKAVTALEADLANPSKQAYNAPEDYLAHSLILSPESSWQNMFLMELVRSCPQECRFCLASYLTRPFRAAKVPAVLEKIKLATPYTKKVGLLGPSVTEHPQFPELADSLLKMPELEISISSIRMDTIDPLVLEMLVKLGQRSLTIALESGSERLRQIMKKNLSQEQIWQSMDLIYASGISQLKFYGIAGLPEEETGDLEETVQLLTSIKKKYRRLKLIFGLSSFVPKAQTPYQWYGRKRDCQRRMEYLRKNLSKVGIEVRMESHNWSDIQAYISRADRRATALLLEVASAGGGLGVWKKHLREDNLLRPGGDFHIFREIPEEECLPWQHIQDAAKTLILKRHKQQSEALAAKS